MSSVVSHAIIPALRSLQQEDCCEFETNLYYSQSGPHRDTLSKYLFFPEETPLSCSRDSVIGMIIVSSLQMRNKALGACGW